MQDVNKEITGFDALGLEGVGTLDAVLIRGDGTHRDLGQLSGPHNFRLIGRPVQWWRQLWSQLKAHKVIAGSMSFAAFLALYGVVDQPQLMQDLFRDPRVVSLIMGCGLAGLVTQAGVNTLAASSGAGTIGAFNYHDSGTGTAAATSTDTGLATQAGPATRATGTKSTPAANQFRSVGTITYTGALAITEWGLFNADSGAVPMWDRRVFGAVNVVNLDSIAYTYTVTLVGGGT
jgi:hypothetical protein